MAATGIYFEFKCLEFVSSESGIDGAKSASTSLVHVRGLRKRFYKSAVLMYGSGTVILRDMERAVHMGNPLNLLNIRRIDGMPSAWIR